VEQSIGRSHRSGQVNPALHAPDRLDEQGRPQWGSMLALWAAHLASCRTYLPKNGSGNLDEEDEPPEGEYDRQPLIQLWANRNV